MTESEKTHAKPKKQSKKSNIKLIVMASIVLILIVCASLYFSPLQSRFVDLYGRMTGGPVTLEKSVTAMGANQILAPTPRTNLSELSDLQDLIYNSTLYTFIMRDLSTQLTASDPIIVPQALIDLLPTSLKYTINKILLDAGIQNGLSALSVYELNDALEKHFATSLARSDDVPSSSMWASIKSWFNPKSWVKIEKIQADDGQANANQTLKKQVSDMQAALMQYDFAAVKKIFVALPQEVQTQLDIWHQNLLLRETFFNIKQALNAAMVAFFKSNMNAAQENIIIEYQIQPKPESE